MRKRDLGILLLLAFAIFFSLQNEGIFSYKEAWIHVLDDTNPIIHEAQRLPPPVVTDLNGDGVRELLVATNDKIQIVEPYVSSATDGFSGARVMAEASLLPSNVRVGVGRRPVALAAGKVKRIYSSGERRKQVVVVVTAGSAVMCFDHNLKKLWEDDIQVTVYHCLHEVGAVAVRQTFSDEDSLVGHGDSALELRTQPLKPCLVASTSKDFHPADILQMASCGIDNTIKIWSLKVPKATMMALATKASMKAMPKIELSSGDGVYLCGHEEEDSKDAYIGKGVIQNVAEGMLHGKVIGLHYVSLTITKSYQDNYPLMEPLTGDDPVVTTVGQAKG